MTTITTNSPARTFPVIEVSDRAADLDAWDDCISAMDGALRDLAGARCQIDELSTLLERMEASAVLRIEGPNAEARKARLTLELADDARYCGLLADLRAARERLADADRRVLVARERCRLLRTSITLTHDAEPVTMPPACSPAPAAFYGVCDAHPSILLVVSRVEPHHRSLVRRMWPPR